MKKFLTSGLILGLAISPAIADTLYNDTKIGESCTADFLGSSSGNAANSFLAQYTPNKYTVAAGEYLAQNGTSGTQCPANSYCPGDTYTFSETNDQGITACPADFNLSAAGTSSADACYHNCTASDIQNGEKVASVKGGTVTAGGINTCDATCTTGYTFKAASGGTNPLSGKENIVTGNESYGYTRLFWSGTGSKETEFGLTPKSGEWAVAFSHGTIKGKSLCSETGGEWATTGIPEDSGSGYYCWCQINEYTPMGGSKQSLSSVWVYYDNFDEVYDECYYGCAEECASSLLNTRFPNFRTTLFGSVDASSSAACVANEITVSWNPANGNAASTNTCTYDGDITLPTAPTKTGYTFSGWKLVTGSSSN